MKIEMWSVSYYSPTQHKLIGFYNRNGECLLRGTDWVFKYNQANIYL